MTNNFWGLKAGFILASGSPQRKALLEQVRLYPDKIVSPDIDESTLPNELPAQYVKRIAVLKAQAVFQENKGVCVVAADTVLAVGRRIMRYIAARKSYHARFTINCYHETFVKRRYRAYFKIGRI